MFHADMDTEVLLESLEDQEQEIEMLKQEIEKLRKENEHLKSLYRDDGK